MLYTMTKRLEICIDLNIQFSEVDHYTWIFTSRIFRLALEITFLHELLSDTYSKHRFGKTSYYP